jgi:hypothetical protein
MRFLSRMAIGLYLTVFSAFAGSRALPCWTCRTSSVTAAY